MTAESLPTPNSWARIAAVFSAVSDAPEAARPALLDELCSDDARLRDAVEELLRADALDTGRLDHSFPRVIAESFGPEDHARFVGRSIGPYRIERVIAEGGMGIVFLATREGDSFRKRVAVKVIRAGVQSGEIVRRFENERRILAELEHSNIAALIDGGTTADGLPYFIMEYVEGVPIDRFCETNRLSVRERLALFDDVCAAVQYAHQKLVIHRDLKPNNILVTADGVVKLLDFGIAKLQAEGERSATETAAEFRILTPDYASPEQIAGRPLDTRTDVYSLGVVLFELLTGERPQRENTERPHAVARRNSHLRIDPDLDNIIVKAMHEDLARRYESVLHLADDIGRYLGGLPVRARRDSFGYRAGKFVRRNKTVVAAALLVLCAVAGGLVMTVRQERIAERERQLADHRFHAVRRMANSLLFELHDSMQRLPGSLEARQLLVRRAFEYLSQLQVESGRDPAVLADLAAAYDHLASVTFDTRAAIRSHQKAVLLYRDLLRRDPENRAYGMGLVTALLGLSDSRKITGDFDAAARDAHEATVFVEGMAARRPNDIEVHQLLDSSHGFVASVEEERGDFTAGLESYRKALAVATRLSLLRPNDPDLGQSLLIDEEHVGSDRAETGDLEGGEVNLRKGLATVQFLLATDRINPIYRRMLWGAKRRLARLLVLQKHETEAAAVYRESLDVIRELSSEDPADTGHRRNMTITEIDLGDTLVSRGKLAEAGAMYTDALSISKALVAADPERLEAQFDYVVEKERLGALSLMKGDRSAAAKHLTAAIDSGEALERIEKGNGRLTAVVAEARRLVTRTTPRVIPSRDDRVVQSN